MNKAKDASCVAAENARAEMENLRAWLAEFEKAHEEADDLRA